MQINLDFDSFNDAKYIANRVFDPLSGFMDKAEFKSVCFDMNLNRELWCIPVTLDAPNSLSIRNKLSQKSGKTELIYEGKIVGHIEISDIFEISKDELFAVFGTDDINHPGIKKELTRSKWRIAGKVSINGEYLKTGLYKNYLHDVLNIKDDKSLQTNKKTTICGFQTRNPVHRAHEHLQRTALELCDYLFINPLIGWKKSGDFAPQAIQAAYKAMMEQFYPVNKVHFAPLVTQMRYAGPKEAIFHAQIRKNMGCTHFIIGRDHAGVGEYYDVYEAQELAKQLSTKHDLGIELLLLKEPYYCEFCEQITSENCCCHNESQKIKISGTKIRECLKRGEIPPAIMMRKEISQAILSLPGEQILML